MNDDCGRPRTSAPTATVRHRYKTRPPLFAFASALRLFKPRPPLSTYFLDLLSIIPLLTFALDSPAATKYWRGGTSSSAKVAANWSDSAEVGAAVSSAAPVTGDAIVLDGATDAAQRAMTWDLNDVTVDSWTQDGYTNVVTFMTGFVGRKAKGTVKTTCGQLTADGTRRIIRVTGNVNLATGRWKGTSHPSMESTDEGWADGCGIYRIEAEIGGDFTVGAAAEVDAVAQGFTPGGNFVVRGEGPGGSLGGCHGGTGWTEPVTSYGNAKWPTTIGSSAWTTAGGAIIISVNGDARLDGALNASANRGTVSYYGGSGGTVNLSARTLSGSGRLLAVGATATAKAEGGGGRIAVHVASGDFSNFTGTYSAAGGGTSKSSAGSCGTIYLEKPSDKGAGELLLVGTGGQMPVNSISFTDLRTLCGTNEYDFSRIVVTNGAWLGIGTGVTVRVSELVGYEDDPLGRQMYDYSPALPDGIYLLGGQLCVPDGFTVTNVAIGARAGGGAIVVGNNELGRPGTLHVVTNGAILGDAAFDVTGSVHVAAGGVLSHTFNNYSDAGWRFDMNVVGDVTLDAGAEANANGKGLNRDASSSGNGGNFAHAGLGSMGGTKQCYGSVRRPTSLGGMGTGYAPISGGAIHLAVSGTLTNNGNFLANGYDNWSGGEKLCGGGGSVWISAGQLLGSGRIVANGHDERYANGNGGGGRIALYLTKSASRLADYSGTITAYGGHSSNWQTIYGAGTVFYHLADEDEEGGTLVIDGGSTNGVKCPLTEFTERVTDTIFDTVIITNGANVKQYQNTTITVRKDWLNYGTYNAENADADNAAGAVVFEDSTQTSRVVGTSNFAEFRCTTEGKCFAFGTNASDIVKINESGRLTLQGSTGSDGKILLAPEGSGTWHLTIADKVSTMLSGLAVSNSDASASATAPVADKSVDLGGNSDNWSFQVIVPGMTNTWVGGAGIGWTQPANWDLGRAPAPTDALVISGSARTMPHLVEEATVNSLTVESGATLALDTYSLTVTNRLTVQGALVASSTESIRVGGDLSFAPGSFTAAKTTLTLTGDAASTANFGGNALWHLVLDRSGQTTYVTGSFTADIAETAASAATEFVFTPGIEAVARLWHIDGGRGDAPLITLRSATVSGGWKFRATDFAYVWGVTVSDSDARGCPTVYAETPSTDGTRNWNWQFGVTSQQWNGSAGTAFENADNWTPSGVPGSTSRIVVGNGAKITIPDEGATALMATITGTVSIAGGTLNLAGSLDVNGAALTLDAPVEVGGSVLVQNGSSVTHTQNATEEGHRVCIRVACNLHVDEGASIDAYGAGFKNGYGPGKGVNIWNPGSHGGRGGDGVCYGSIRHPTESGSSNGANGWRTYGGGVVYISVQGLTTVNGSICASGRAFDGWYGAAGGSVWLTTGTLKGSGSISARGAAVEHSGSGGGGRVAVYLTEKGASFDDYDGTIDAHSGKASGSNHRGAGTVFLATADTPPDGGTLIIADRLADFSGSWTDFPIVGEKDNWQYANLTVKVSSGGKILCCGPIRIGECEMDSKSTLKLNGKALRVVSRAHCDRTKARDALGHYKGNWSGTVDYSVTGSTILWGTGGGLMMIVR